MSRVHRVGVISGSRSGAKTYADFVAHITTLADGIPSQGISGVIPWANSFASGQGGSFSGRFRTTASTETGTMYGTTWLQSAGYGWAWVGGSAACRAIQHGMPSQAAFLDQVAASRQIYYSTNPGGSRTCYALSRNGYQSDGGDDVISASIGEIIYWDGTQAQKMRPFLGTGPTPYTW